MSRAAQLDCQHERSCALVLTLFLFQKGQGFFPPLPIAALLPRSWRWAGLPIVSWDVSMWLSGFAVSSNEDFCSDSVGGWQTHSLQGMNSQRVWGREP